MNDPTLNDAILLFTEGERHEILVETNQRTRADVQDRLQTLLSEYPDIPTRLVSLSEMQDAAKRMADAGAGEGAGADNGAKPGAGERIIRRKDLEDTSESEHKILSYFEVARLLGASDIHFLISTTLFIVRMRIFGELYVVDEDKPDAGYALCATAILSMSDVTEPSFYPQREQDARLSPRLMRKVGIFGARYSHRPTGDGLIAVMRLIPDDGHRVPDFVQLGFLPQQIALLAKLLLRPEGKIILSGPTGSGKSTTLRSACRVYLDENPGRHLLTVEDPLEGEIHGATQTPIICDKSDETAISQAWGRAIRSGMRLDPDSIMEGEMRDLVSMMVTIYAAQTGHLVLTTLHTNSAFGIPERMVTMGVNPELICDPQLLIGMISQRLVPTLCPHCRIPWSEKVASLSPEQTAFLTRYGNREGICSTENMYFRNHEGCPACNRDVVINGRKRATVGRGVTGRTVIAEVVETDARLFRLLRTEGKEAARQYWLEHMNGISRVEHLLHRISEGRVDPLEATRIVPLDEDERLAVDIPLKGECHA